MEESQPLHGRNIIITGGTGGLGRVVVSRLIAAGAICHVPSHRREAPSAGPQLHITPGIDLTSEDDVAHFYADVPDLWASVHLAGGFVMGAIEGAGAEALQHMFAMNVTTTYLCSRAAVAAMRQTGKGGRIVNVAARPALEPRKGARMLAYGAAKAAVAALTQGLAEEVKGDHILVNAIAPSTIDTKANRESMPKADPAKWLSPESAAEAVLMLVSPAATEISGAILPLYARA